MEINFSGKRALVTGAAGDIGSVIVTKLIDCGAQVVALDVNREALDTLKSKLPGVETLCVNLLDWTATKEAGENCGDIDLLVNCAAAFSFQDVGQVDEEDMDRVLGVNVKAIVNLIQAVTKGMIARKCRGAIVNISSLGSRTAVKGLLSYCVSKAGVDMVTKMVALELGPYQIRTNAINPTIVDTKVSQGWKEKNPEQAEGVMKNIPLGRIASKEEVTDAVLFLLSDRATMINGAMLNVDGGASAC